eukprot:176695_1
MSNNFLADSVITAVNEISQTSQQQSLTKQCNSNADVCYYFDKIYNWHQFSQENLNHMISINHWKDQHNKPKCEHGTKCYAFNRILNTHIYDHNRIDDKCHMEIYFHPTSKDKLKFSVDTLTNSNSKLIEYFNSNKIKTLTLDLFIEILQYLPITDIFNIIYNDSYKLPINLPSNFDNKTFQIWNIYLHSTDNKNINNFQSYWNSITLSLVFKKIRSIARHSQSKHEWAQKIQQRETNIDINLDEQSLELLVHPDEDEYYRRGNFYFLKNVHKFDDLFLIKDDEDCYETYFGDVFSVGDNYEKIMSEIINHKLLQDYLYYFGKDMVDMKCNILINLIWCYIVTAVNIECKLVRLTKVTHLMYLLKMQCCIIKCI